ncbi:MAG: hypothetical protein DI570_28510 [Phenylobacterium zucineum]|nr:MAG: hypothetical protein DI570_28510 [Phenylobacterium zucineum]
MRPPRVYQRAVKKLTRMRVGVGAAQGRTLYFTFPGGTRAGRCRVTFLDPGNVPEFDGDEAWFEVEQVEGRPWAFWRAVRRVGGPPDA